MKTVLISCLAYRPRLLILDEPFSGLDPLARQDMIQGMLENAGETTVFVSSHDLAEIESFASHIGYLDAGHLQFSEEMTSLSDRFREVEVIVRRPPVLPQQHWPSNWLRPEAAQAMVRFVETAFEQDKTFGQVRQVFDGVEHISANPMPLRSIFVALARSPSKPV